MTADSTLTAATIAGMGRERVLHITVHDCEVQTFRCGGKGGQNKDKRDTGVRIIHRPSGARGECREERAIVDAAIERICTDLWAKLHEHDSLRAGRDWKDIQEWLEDKRPRGDSIGARVADGYQEDVARHRALVVYPLEWGFIEGVRWNPS